MRTKYFIFLLLLLLSISQSKAQNKRQTFTFLCNKVEGDNILGVFTYFKGLAVGKLNTFLTVTYFRGYEPNIEYKSRFILQHPNGKTEVSNVISMYQRQTLHRHVHHWENIFFEEKGTYKIKVYLNDILQEEMTFEVKD